MPTRVIALCGRAGSGKDCTADIITDYINGMDPDDSPGKVFKLSFADDIKKICSELFDVPIMHFYDRDLKETPMATHKYMSPRKLLTMVGTDWVRTNYDEDFWINKLIYKAKKIIEEHDDCVILITDVRFMNEAMKVKDELSAYTVMIDADERLGAPVSAHCSEHGFVTIRRTFEDRFPSDFMVIYNNRCKDYLESHIKLMTNYILRRMNK